VVTKAEAASFYDQFKETCGRARRKAAGVVRAANTAQEIGQRLKDEKGLSPLVRAVAEARGETLKSLTDQCASATKAAAAVVEAWPELGTE